MPLSLSTAGEVARRFVGFKTFWFRRKGGPSAMPRNAVEG